MQSQHNRDLFSKEFDEDIRGKLDLGSGSIKMELHKIVNACLAFTGGIYKLLSLVAHFEGESSLSFQNLQTAYAEVAILCNIKGFEESLGFMKQILGGVQLDEPEIGKIIDSTKSSKTTSNRVITDSAYIACVNLLADDPPSGLKFLEALARRGEVDKTIKQMILNLMLNVAPKFGIPDDQIDELRKKAEMAANATVYLQIKIEENNLVDETYYVRAWLWRAGNDRKQVELRNPNLINTPFSFSGVEDVVREMVSEVEKQVIAQEIIVELFAPRNLFAKDIWNWQVEVGEILGRLLTQFPVVLRWLDRVATHDKHLRRWWRKWEALQNLLNQGLPLDWKWLAHNEEFPSGDITNGWVNAQDGVCLALGFTPHSRPKNEDRLHEALNVGAPIILWFCESWTKGQIHEKVFEEVRTGVEIMDLPKRVWELRQQAYKDKDPDATGRHLMLLFDDPNRIPTDFVPGHLRGHSNVALVKP